MSATDGRSRKRPGVEAQRDRVRTAAAELFVTRGSRSVSVAEICAGAGVSRPTFYRCYPDKEALVADLYELAVHGAIQLNLAEVLGERAPTDPRAALDQLVDRILERPVLAAFVFVESADPASEAHTIVRRAFAENAAAIEAWYAARGASPPPRMALQATMVACQWIVHEALRKGLEPVHRAEAKDAMWALVRGVFALG